MSNNTSNDAPDDDTDGHKFVPVDERSPGGLTTTAETAETADDDDPDDTEGHRVARHNVGVEFD